MEDHITPEPVTPTAEEEAKKNAASSTDGSVLGDIASQITFNNVVMNMNDFFDGAGEALKEAGEVVGDVASNVADGVGAVVEGIGELFDGL